MSFIVYGASLSPFVRKVRVFLAEKGIAYSQEQITPMNMPDWYADISPMKKIPAFRDTDLPEPNTLPDSSIICDYVEHKKPEPALYPKDAYARGRALWFEEYADTAMAQSIGAGLFFERIVTLLIGRTPDEAKIKDTLENKLPPLFDYLEKQLGKNEFFVDGKFSIADIAMGTQFVNLAHAGESVDADRWPNLARFVTRVHARPSFKACIDEEAGFIKSLKK